MMKIPNLGLRTFTSIPARITSVTSVRDRNRILLGWEFKCQECHLSTTFPPDDLGYNDAVQFRIDHKCYSKHDPNQRVTIQRASLIHSSSQGPGRA